MTINSSSYPLLSFHLGSLLRRLHSPYLLENVSSFCCGAPLSHPVSHNLQRARSSLPPPACKLYSIINEFVSMLHTLLELVNSNQELLCSNDRLLSSVTRPYARPMIRRTAHRFGHSDSDRELFSVLVAAHSHPVNYHLQRMRSLLPPSARRFYSTRNTLLSELRAQTVFKLVNLRN